MEEHIQTIIKKHAAIGNIPITLKEERTAKEIATDMLKYIDWLAKEVTLKIVWHDNIGYTKEWHYLPDKWGFETGKNWSLNELFTYWLYNVKNK